MIEFAGNATNNGYRLRNSDGSYWNDSRFKVLEWSMRYSESFTVYVAVQTKNGFRYLYYTPANADSLGTGTYVHHGLGSHAADGKWHTFIRDLAHDLKDAQPDNELQAVLGFLIRGSGRVDDVRTRSAIPEGWDSDGDGLTDRAELESYGTSPYSADTDNDGLADKEEREHWGESWNGDIDGDGLINLLDPDADNDGFNDGIEISQSTDPGSSTSAPTTIVYEDAEDGSTTGWDIYDCHLSRNPRKAGGRLYRWELPSTTILQADRCRRERRSLAVLFKWDISGRLTEKSGRFPCGAEPGQR